MSDRHEGGCLCGAVRYETNGTPKWVAHCHCESCRSNTGCPVTTFVGWQRDNFRYTSGTPQRYVSSPGVYRSFCATCGTPLTYGADRCADEVHVYVATYDRPQDFPATAHVHYAERIPWFDTKDSHNRYRTGSTRGEPMSDEEIAELSKNRD